MYHQRVPVAALILLAGVIAVAVYIGTRPVVTTPMPVLGPAPDPAQTTEIVLGGGIRLSCVESCQQDLVYPFNEAVLYDTLDEFIAAMSGSEKQVSVAWLPATDHLYIDQADAAQLPEQGHLELLEEYMLTAQVQFPEPSPTEAPATANLGVTQGPRETIAQVISFFGEIGFDDNWAELSLAMEDNDDSPINLEEAYFIVSQPSVRGAGYQLHVFDTPPETENTDPTRACLQNPTWFYRLRYCTYYWW